MPDEPEPAQPKSARPEPPGTPLTLRVLLLALFLIPLNAWWQIEIEYVRYSDNASTQALFFNVVSLLLILIGLNSLLRRLCPRWMFTPQELVAIYVALAVATNLAGHDQLQILFTTLTYVFRHDTPETGWGTKIIPYLPRHLMVQDRAAIDALYTGNTTLYRWDHIQPWLVPLGWWTLFVLLVVWTMYCLTALFRRQWEAERLSYPIAEIPIQLINQPRALFRSPMLWGGVAIGAAGQIFNFLHSLFPSIPGADIGVQNFDFNTYPWNAVGTLPLCTYPFAYGLAFLLPTQLGFSVWFFFLLSRIELLAAAMWGYTDVNSSGHFPYLQPQQVGAIFGLFLSLIWTARGHLHYAWRTALSGKEQSGSEPLSYRTSVFGLIVGIGGLIWFAVAAGMRLQTAVLFLGILFVIVIVVARMRAELGLPTFELYQAGASQILQRFSGTAAYPRGDLTVMTLFFWLERTHRQFPMQTQVDAVRLGRRTQTPTRSLSVLLLGASVVGTMAAFWAMLHSMYIVGYDSAKFRGPGVWAFGADPWQKLDNWITSPQPPNRGAVGAYLFGAGFTLFLAAMRARLFWWPFHPAGYMVSGSFGLFRLWLPIFVSWLAKSLILRYGGLKAYRRFLPFFLGLILGEFSVGFLRTLLDLIFGLHLPPESGIGGL
jgi:hypothetical protein